MDRGEARTRLGAVGQHIDDVRADAQRQWNEAMADARRAIADGIAAELSDTEMAKLLRLNRNTVNPIARELREGGGASHDRRGHWRARSTAKDLSAEPYDDPP